MRKRNDVDTFSGVIVAEISELDDYFLVGFSGALVRWPVEPSVRLLGSWFVRHFYRSFLTFPKKYYSVRLTLPIIVN